ncbi:hypothetical protein [Chitinivibrio alkaliphilus]|uniref:Uncharacterized protein n=1 Tax=Chitinivibrio alkaliphilus ACht1 TaxID=1313304 RepID=U7DAW9_9BACT|nr:hypothetical protein [Chitinivibrio alkaliphilus]ERP31550.1 hypothetical protein CALK_1595 [Chitinivibrio alkaliphilus ACht1]
MDIPALLIRITGVVIFCSTVYFFTRHLRKESKEARNAEVQSTLEYILNSVILYVWYAFITAFSLGMIFNN